MADSRLSVLLATRVPNTRSQKRQTRHG